MNLLPFIDNKIIYFLLFLLPINLYAEFGPVNDDNFILVTECPVKVVEVEVPVYLPAEQSDSVSIIDISAGKIYLYDSEIYEGPKPLNQYFPYAVLDYEGGGMFRLVEWDL